MYKIGQISHMGNLSVSRGDSVVGKGEVVNPTHAFLLRGF